MTTIEEQRTQHFGPAPIDELLRKSHQRPRLEVPDALKPLRENPTILVVEDDDLTREITIRELKKQYKNATFLEARNGAEAIGHLSKDAASIDCMVLDFCLGDKPDEVHGEGVLAYMGEKRILCPTVVRSGSWSNPETISASEQITEGIIRGVYTPELKDRELRQISAVPGLPVFVDFMGKGDNFDLLAARLDMVRLHSGREADKLGQELTPVDEVVGTLIKDILAGLNVKRRETTPTRYWISRLEGSGNDFSMFFRRFAKEARKSGEYQTEDSENLRSAVEVVEKETEDKRFSFENLMVTAGSSHPNAHALLNRLLICRDLVVEASKKDSEIGGIARGYAPDLKRIYDQALGHYRKSKTRERTNVDIAGFMDATLKEAGAVHGLPIEYRAPWDDVGGAVVDPALLKVAVTELITNACKAAKKGESPEVGVRGCSFTLGNLPPHVKEVFAEKGIVSGSAVDLTVHNNGPPMEDELIDALNRGDTSRLGESTLGTAGSGLKSLMEDVLPNLPGALFFENIGGQTGVSLFIPEAKSEFRPVERPNRIYDIYSQPDIVVEETAPGPSVRTGGTAKARVILVDDYREFPDGMRKMISDAYGDTVDVEICTTVDQFLKASEKPFDVVVSDYVLEAPYLQAAVKDEERGKGRTGRTVCRIARERNPSAKTVIYSIDDVYNPAGSNTAGVDPNAFAPADPSNTDWGVNKGNSELLISDGREFRRPTKQELDNLGIESKEHWNRALIKIIDPTLRQKIQN